MKIRDINITPIALSDPPLLSAAGRHQSYALRLVVEIVSDDGISGLAELPGGVKGEAALREFAPRLDGHDPFDFNRLDRLIDEHFGNPQDTDPFASSLGSTASKKEANARRRKSHVRSAFEVACYDLIGKAMNKRVADLLGGVVRREVPCSAYLFFKYEGGGGELGVNKAPGLTGWEAQRQEAALTPEGIVAEADAMIKAFGFKSIKLKGGAFDPELETNAILALRDHFGPDMPLRFDPNACWSMETARKWGKIMGPALQYYEDPVRGQEQMAELSKELGIPFATNMCTTALADLPGSLRLGSEQIILSDHHFWGGFQPCMTLAQFCKVFGRGLSMHSNSHAGISLMAMAHLAAATPNLTYAVDTHYPWQREDIIVGGRYKIENGNITLPDGPGLGVELDRAALDRLHKQYLAAGIEERDDQTEMRKFRPEFTATPTQF
jgi:glucarate dehydratase